MNKKEKSKYYEARPIGVVGLSNTVSIEVMDILYGIDDYIVWRFNIDPKRIHKARIDFKPERPRFRANSMTVHLDEVMRI